MRIHGHGLFSYSAVCRLYSLSHAFDRLTDRLMDSWRLQDRAYAFVIARKNPLYLVLLLHWFCLSNRFWQMQVIINWRQKHTPVKINCHSALVASANLITWLHTTSYEQCCAVYICTRHVRILRQKNENSGCITCKFCTSFSWILCPFTSQAHVLCPKCRPLTNC